MRTPPTPSSLKWLINRRTRLAGELEKAKMVASNRLLQEQKDVANAKAVLMKIEKDASNARSLHEKYIQVLEQSLSATDLLLREHEIPIEPNELPVVWSHAKPRVAPRSQITRCIFEAIANQGNPSLSTTEIAVYAASKIYSENLEKAAFSEFKYRVRKRLGYLAWQGRLKSIYLPKSSIEGRWMLL